MQLTGQMELASPGQACSTLTNPAAISGKIAIVDRGSCSFQTKVIFWLLFTHSCLPWWFLRFFASNCIFEGHSGTQKLGKSSIICKKPEIERSVFFFYVNPPRRDPIYRLLKDNTFLRNHILRPPGRIHKAYQLPATCFIGKNICIKPSQTNGPVHAFIKYSFTIEILIGFIIIENYGHNLRSTWFIPPLVTLTAWKLDHWLLFSRFHVFLILYSRQVMQRLQEQ